MISQYQEARTNLRLARLPRLLLLLWHRGLLLYNRLRLQHLRLEVVIRENLKAIDKLNLPSHSDLPSRSLRAWRN